MCCAEVMVKWLRCSGALPRVFRCLVDRLCFRQGRIRHKLVSGKKARDRTLILRLTGVMSLPLSGSPTAYLAVGKRAPGVADELVQVILVRLQGNADECSGRSSHSPPLSVVLVPVET